MEVASHFFGGPITSTLRVTGTTAYPLISRVAFSPATAVQTSWFLTPLVTTFPLQCILFVFTIAL